MCCCNSFSVQEFIPILTPIVTGLIGIILLKRIEGIKNEVSKSYEFSKMWADDFFKTCREFMQGIERVLSLFVQLESFNDPNDEVGTAYQKEITLLYSKLSELGLRLRRLSGLSPNNSNKLKEAATNLLASLAKINNERKGNLDAIIEQINTFNNISKDAHSEMLRMKSK